jgi:hypothetical protein
MKIFLTLFLCVRDLTHNFEKHGGCDFQRSRGFFCKMYSGGCGSAAARHASRPPRWLAPVRENGRSF